MNVAICEDEESQRRLLTKAVQWWACARGIQVAVHEYANAKAFFFGQGADGPFDLYLLDIGLGEGSEGGIQLAKAIREADPYGVIVFVTGHLEYVLKGYKVQAFDYLMKPVKQHELAEACDHALDFAGKMNAASFLYTTNTESKRVNIGDILYFHAQREWVEIHTVRGVDMFRTRFADVIEELGARHFVQNHRSYFVNVSHIQSLGKTSLRLDNGDTLPVSRQQRKRLFDGWLGYFGTNTPASAPGLKCG
jgi:DNA-binding LytR/AlgR family response regulator